MLAGGLAAVGLATAQAADTNDGAAKPAAAATVTATATAKAGAGPALAVAANHCIGIPRAALGKEYLLSGSVIPQALSPTSTALAGRIVRFELFADGVDMYEATKGLVVTDDLPARRLLASFPIVEQDDTKVVIDFNKGMRRVFTDIWYSGGSFNAAGRERTLEVPQSRVFDVKQDGDRLVIRQSAQTRSRAEDQDREERYELRYFIAPYQQSDFKSKELSASESRYVSYFEVQPQMETTSGRVTSKIIRFDLNQPVQFYYSANTPADYVQAVKDGILYWNKAFGKEVVKADKAPDGVTAPDVSHNIIQWVPWDSAGFAYADVIVDPRTGAAQHGQAYITSVFATGSRGSVRQLLRTMRGLADGKETKEKDGKPKPEKAEAADERHPFGTSFLETASLCRVDVAALAEQTAAGIESLLADGKLDDAAVLRLSQDYVRDVVAHEVGHILGLSHNFAGSVAATLTPKELDDWFHDYVVTPETNRFAGKISGSSVMDYDVFKSRVFIGHFIGTAKEALPYDRAAIQWGYFDSHEAQEKKLLYAMFGWADVRTFDYGADPVVGAYANLADTIQNLPNGLVETFIRAKAPRDPRDRVPLAEINLNPNAAAFRITGEIANILTWFRAGTRSVKVENAFEFVGDLNHREVVQAHWKALNDQVEKVGGLDRLVFGVLPLDLKLEFKGEPKGTAVAEKMDAKKLTERLGKLLESPAYTNFVGLDEKTYTFSKEEKELILKRGKTYFEQVEKEVVRRAAGVFERASRDLGVEANKMVGDDDIIAQLDKRIIDFAKVVIMAKNDEERREGKVDKSIVTIVDFKYDLDTRVSAARALADPIGSFKGWSVDAKGDLNKQLKDDIDAALNVQNFKDFQESSLSRRLREWYMNQQAVLMLLPPKRPR